MALATAKILEDASSHDGKSYNLVGEEIIPLTVIAEVLTDITGSPVSYVQVPHATVVDGLAKAFGGNRHAAEHIASMVHRSSPQALLTLAVPRHRRRRALGHRHRL